MSATTFDVLLESALSLPLEQRSRMADRLIESIDDDDDAELSPAWQQEISRRIDDARHGVSKRIPHEDVMDSVRRQITDQKA